MSRRKTDKTLILERTDVHALLGFARGLYDSFLPGYFNQGQKVGGVEFLQESYFVSADRFVADKQSRCNLPIVKTLRQ